MLRQSRASAGEHLTVAAIAACAWAVTASRMQGMDMGPGTDLGGLGWFAGVWIGMMAAMMLPSLAPRATLPFAAGFMLPWAAVGPVAYALFEGVRSLDLAFLHWGEAGPYVAGAVIAGAAVYEVTPTKRSCLRRCRKARIRAPDLLGELRAGTVEGTFCIGCCWALMAALFALGVMSIAWMVVFGAVVAVQKLLPSERAAGGATIALLLALALAVVLFPEHLPGLAVPMA